MVGQGQPRQRHIDELQREIVAFRDSSPYSLTPEPTDMPGRVAYRLKYHQSFPVHLSTIVGDAVNSLRGAPEAVAYEVARQCHGGQLTGKQTRDSTFPICKTPTAFAEFFARKGDLYDKRAQRAFLEVQPFKIIEDMREAGVEPGLAYDESWTFAALPRLNHVWNLDKHRRLALMAWWPDLIWWGSNGPSNRKMLRGDGTLAHDSVLFYVEGEDDGPGTEINHEFHIVLTDDLAFDGDDGDTSDLTDLMERWHQFIVSDAFPKIFTLMPMPPASGGPLGRRVFSSGGSVRPSVVG